MTEDKNIIVIPSRTVPQGITALVNFMPDLGPEENTRTMTEEMGNVRTAQITYAVRTTNIDGIDIEEGDIMALGDHGMLAVGKSVDGVALDAMKEMLDEECCLLYTSQLIAGEDPMVAGAAGKKPLSIAIDELYHQKVKILPEEETTEEEEQNA